MTYDELRSTFTDLLKRRDLTTSMRDAWLQDGLSRCQTDLRVPAMEKQFVATIDSRGVVDIPNDYLELRSLYVDPDELKQRDLSTVLRLRKGTTNYPKYYVRRGAQWLLAPYPLSGTQVHGDYYAELPGLVNGTDSNWLSLIRPLMIVNAALVSAAPHFVDRRKDDFEATYQMHLAALQSQSDEDELSNAQVQPGFDYPCDLD